MALNLRFREMAHKLSSSLSPGQCAVAYYIVAGNNVITNKSSVTTNALEATLSCTYRRLHLIKSFKLPFVGPEVPTASLDEGNAHEGQ